MTRGSAPTEVARHGRLHETFDLNDVNHDGRLTLGEFIRLIREHDSDMTAEDCQTAFDEVDTDRDGLIDFAQLLRWWSEQG